MAQIDAVTTAGRPVAWGFRRLVAERVTPTQPVRSLFEGS
jgi:hypothetical protein